MRVSNLTLCTASAIFITGCTGNGVQYARIANDETLTTTGSVFIGRESQWFGPRHIDRGPA